VAIDRAFAIGRAAVTRGQFAAFVKATSHVAAGATVSNKQGSSFYNPEASWRTPGIPQDDSHPALCISWADAKAYAAWLSQVTGQQYRLPSEAEWEYACRAGTATPFWWGSSITPAQVNYDYLSQGAFRRYLPPNWDYSQRRERRDTTVPVDQFAPNPWGLYQVHGNAWEWCEDAWHDTYDGAPLDGSAWMQGDDVSHHVLRGGHLLAVPAFVRAASRVHNAADQRNDGYAIRLARML
jgi:formylglycine-generating enzyme required for sulfatase activity